MEQKTKYKLISRVNARELGLKRFFTGIPCMRNHIDEKYVNSGKCATCSREDLTKARKLRIAWRPRVFPKVGYQVCTCCGVEKLYEEFHKTDRNKMGRNPQCATCVNDRQKQWKFDNPENVKKSAKDYRLKNRESEIEYANLPHIRTARNLRIRIYYAIKNKQKVGSAVDDLGCTINWFMDYIAWYFEDGMTWENQGDVWHMDHIIPLISFDLEDREHFLKAAHYTNMQPLSIKDNLSKGAKLNWTPNN